jgi:hypothetical protein
MRAKVHASLLLLLVAAALTGCSRNNLPTSSSGSVTATQAEVMTEMTQQPGVIEDGVSDSELEYSADAGGLAAIRPLAFWRRFRAHERTFEYAYSDSDSTGRPTRAIVTIRTHLVGTFNIRAGAAPPDSTGNSPGIGIGVGAALLNAPRDSTIHTVTKPLDEVRVRRVVLRRLRLPHDVPRDADCDHDSTRVRWRVAGVSGVEVTSQDNTTDIVSVHVEAGALETTITDPLEFIRLRGLLKLDPGASVKVTVTTTHNDDVVLLHHNDRRFKLTANGDGTYSGEFSCRRFTRGLWHFGVDAISHATLFDDAAAYDSQRWVFPYVVAPERLDGPPLSGR